MPRSVGASNRLQASRRLSCWRRYLSVGDPDATRLALLKCREAARYLNISERKLWDLTQRGEIPHIPIGRAVRYDPRDLQAWVEAQKKLGTEKEQINGKHLS